MKKFICFLLMMILSVSTVNAEGLKAYKTQAKMNVHKVEIDVEDQTGTDHETSADGIHPTSWGYKRWADAIQKPLLKIFKKYGIK